MPPPKNGRLLEIGKVPLRGRASGGGLGEMFRDCDNDKMGQLVGAFWGT